MLIKKFVISFLLAILSSGVLTTIMTHTTKNGEVQNSYCQSLEYPGLLPEMKPIIRRDCIGELDRIYFGKAFWYLLPVFAVLLFGVFYNNENDI